MDGIPTGEKIPIRIVFRDGNLEEEEKKNGSSVTIGNTAVETVARFLRFTIDVFK